MAPTRNSFFVSAVFLTEMLHVEGGARTGHPSYVQVIREDDLAILTINPDWVTARCAPA